jgi:hypothetical protein
MAYNAVSGTIITSCDSHAGWFDGSLTANTVSGNLSTSDGANVINVPRVSNATNNAILTNVDGNANSLVCESNLTFDGSLLSITGHLTASIGISASYFTGDGSKLTGISGVRGPAGGIFTEVNGTKAYTTSSLQVGSSATPSYTLSVAGTTMVDGTYILTGNMHTTGALHVDGNFFPTTANIHDLGSAAKPWRNLYVSSSTIYFGTDTLSVQDNNLKFGSGSTTKGFDVGFMNFKNNGIFMDPGYMFKLRAYQIQMFGGIGFIRKVVADDYTIREIDYLVGIQSDTLTASMTLTLPAASGLLNGQTYVVKDEGGALDTHAVTVTTQGSDVIEGQTSVVLESPYASIQIYCNGLNKYFIY